MVDQTEEALGSVIPTKQVGIGSVSSARSRGAMGSISPTDATNALDVLAEDNPPTQFDQPTEKEAKFLKPTTSPKSTPEGFSPPIKPVTPEMEDIAEEAVSEINQSVPPTSSLRPKARPDKKLQSAVKKIIELGYVQRREAANKNEEELLKSFDSTFRTVTNLTESKNLETITKFITQALGAEDPNLDVTKEGVYWCAAFVNHILTEMGADTLGKGDRYNRLRAKKYANYGKEVSLEDMQEGDILLFGYGNEISHVGFYTGERSGNTVNMMGGNQFSGVVDAQNNPIYEVNSVPRNLRNIVGVRRVTYDGDSSRIVSDQKVADPIFRYFETPNYEAKFNPSSNKRYAEGGLATQTEEALGWTAEGKKFADANPVEVKENQESTALSIADVPVFDRPMDASESDKWTGVQDELGNRQYKTIFGRTYFVRPAEDQRSNYEKIQQDIIPAVKSYLDNPTAPSREQTIDFLKQSLGAAWETFKIPGDLAAGNKGMEDVTLGNIFELAGGTGAASTVGKVPGGDSSNTLRTFGGSNPPTYNPREKSFSSQVDDFSGAASDAYLDLLNTDFIIFREPISEFAETVSIPKKGLLGSEFLNLIKKNDSIPETSLQEGIIDPQKRYSREELLSAVGKDSRGLFANIANIASDKPKQFENFQRQIRDAGFIGGMEVEYFDIPISSNIGYPGKNFKANDQHYSDDTLVHVRGSIIDPSQSDLSVPTLNTPDQNFVMDVQGENYLLVEEIQSDLLTKGYLKPGNEFDRLFKQSTEFWGNQNQVAYSEIFGSVDKEIKSIIKELVKEGVKSPTTVDAFGSVQKLNSTYPDRGFILSTELTEVLDDLSSLEGSTLLDLENFVKDFLGDNKEGIVNFDTAETLSIEDFFKSYKYVPHKQRKEEYLDKLEEKLRKKKINKEVYRSDLDELYSGFLTYSYRFDQDNTDYGLPPIRKNKQAVDEALKVLIAKAAQSDVSFIVIPPAERIALARGRDLKKDKGDRFYRTYVTDLEKSLSELEANYPVKVFNAELPYKRHEKFVGFVPDMGDSINTGTSSTGTIIDISELINKYKVEEPRQFAQGGVVDNMNNQMEMIFNEGGIADDGMRRDPVSGNEIPPGSLAEEVRDDIPAQLSEGEYVVPADVVRFFGVKFFEDLRTEAKMGLSNMEANGRIGGEPVGPSGMEENPLTPEEMAVLEQMGMAAGGFVPQQEPPQAIGNSVQGFAPGGDVQPVNNYQDGTAGLPSWASIPGASYMPQQWQQENLPSTTSYKPVQTITTADSAPATTTTADTTTATAEVTSTTGKEACEKMGMVFDAETQQCILKQESSGSDDPAVTPDPGTEGFQWKEPDVDYFSMSDEDLAKVGLETSNKFETKVGKIGASLLAGPAGIAAFGLFDSARQGSTIAEVRSAALVAAAKGNTTLADTLNKRAEELVGKSSLLVQGADYFGALSGVNDFVQQIASFAPINLKINKELFGDNEVAYQRAVMASVTPKDEGLGKTEEERAAQKVLSNKNSFEELSKTDRSETWEGQTKEVGGVKVKQFQPAKTAAEIQKSKNDDKDSPEQAAAKSKAKAEAAASRLGVNLATGGRYKGGLMKKTKKK